MGNYESNSQSNERDTANIVVPDEFLDPITNKIMKSPTMILSSMEVYDRTTIDKWIESKRYCDPMTGIPLSVGGWPLLLQSRDDIKEEIKNFIEKYPLYNNENSPQEPIDWKSLIETQSANVDQKHSDMLKEDANLRTQAKQLFKQSDQKTDSDTIEINGSVILQPNIPVICFMGPSRNGKSTIINDILDVRDACIISENPTNAETKGGWIAKYSTKPPSKMQEGVVYQVLDTNNGENDIDEKKEHIGNELYLLDMEGLSHDVTTRTKRLFYACYATSNIVVWNDKMVSGKEFKTWMMDLKNEMQAVAMSDRKPSFIYLKRDCGDFKYKPWKSFDEYINKDESFAWFREMNIFSSLSAFQLKRPIENDDDEDEPLNFSTLERNRKLLKPFVDKLILLSKTSKRFSTNSFILKQQIEHINKSTALSMTKKLINESCTLYFFDSIAPKGDPWRKREMVYLACYFNWNHIELHNKFTEEITRLKLMQKTYEKIVLLDTKTLDEITRTKNEMYERIKNKRDLKNYGSKLSTPAGITGVGAGTLVLGLGVVSTISAPIILAGLAASGAIGYLSGYSVGKAIEIAEMMAVSCGPGNYMKYELGPTDEEMKNNIDESTSSHNWYYWSSVEKEKHD